MPARASTYSGQSRSTRSRSTIQLSHRQTASPKEVKQPGLSLAKESSRTQGAAAGRFLMRLARFCLRHRPQRLMKLYRSSS